MNEANAPHWTLYRRTANIKNHPRTLPMRTTPTWLMSIGFPRKRDAIRRRGIKEPARFSLEITRRAGPPPEGSITCRPDSRQGGDLAVCLDYLPVLRGLERSHESLLRPLREADGRRSGRFAFSAVVPVGDPARRTGSDGGVSVFPESPSPPCDRRFDPLGDVRRLDEELRELLRRLLRPRARERPHRRISRTRDLWYLRTCHQFLPRWPVVERPDRCPG